MPFAALFTIARLRKYLDDQQLVTKKCDNYIQPNFLHLLKSNVAKWAAAGAGVRSSTLWTTIISGMASYDYGCNSGILRE